MAGLPEDLQFTCHPMRRTHATALAMARVSSMQGAVDMGHSDSRTFDRYVRFDGTQRQEIANKINYEEAKQEPLRQNRAHRVRTIRRR